MNPKLCLLLNFASTWAMVGLIWMVQLVHYPLFAKIGRDQFPEYLRDHQRLITLIVLPLMVVELATSIYLLAARPAGTSRWMVIIGVALVAVIWLSTFLIQVPQHERLLNGFDAAVCRRLVQGNWIRTLAWSLRGFISGWMVWTIVRA